MVYFQLHSISVLFRILYKKLGENTQYLTSDSSIKQKISDFLNLNFKLSSSRHMCKLPPLFTDIKVDIVTARSGFVLTPAWQEEKQLPATQN